MSNMAKTKKPSADRHGPRRTISLNPEEYQQLQALADRNNRPVLWQLRMILHQALKAEGLWPPPPPDAD
jgi:predicted DNA-binding ribbon-helix-helix protein